MRTPEFVCEAWARVVGTGIVILSSACNRFVGCVGPRLESVARARPRRRRADAGGRASALSGTPTAMPVRGSCQRGLRVVGPHPHAFSGAAHRRRGARPDSSAWLNAASSSRSVVSSCAVVVARHIVDEGERSRWHDWAPCGADLDGSPVLMRALRLGRVGRHRPGRILQARRRPFRVQGADRLVLQSFASASVGTISRSSSDSQVG